MSDGKQPIFAAGVTIADLLSACAAALDIRTVSAEMAGKPKPSMSATELAAALMTSDWQRRRHARNA